MTANLSIGCGAYVAQGTPAALRGDEDGQARTVCPGKNVEERLPVSQSPDGIMKCLWKPVPFERYRYPMTYYSDNFRFAGEKGE